jgi:hypothetical protein
MHKNATKCNETICKWCKNKHGASKIIDTFETYHPHPLFNYGYHRSKDQRGDKSLEHGWYGFFSPIILLGPVPIACSKPREEKT